MLSDNSVGGREYYYKYCYKRNRRLGRVCFNTGYGLENITRLIPDKTERAGGNAMGSMPGSANVRND
jgi:hypothetical protein